LLLKRVPRTNECARHQRIVLLLHQLLLVRAPPPPYLRLIDLLQYPCVWLGLGGLGWIQLSFWGRSQSKRVFGCTSILGQTQPISVFGWRIRDGAAPFSVWLKEFSVWWTSTRLERLRPPDFDGRVQPASEKNIPLWSQPNPPILQPNSHGNVFAPTRLTPLSNQTRGTLRDAVPMAMPVRRCGERAQCTAASCTCRAKLYDMIGSLKENTARTPPLSRSRRLSSTPPAPNRGNCRS